MKLDEQHVLDELHVIVHIDYLNRLLTKESIAERLTEAVLNQDNQVDPKIRLLASDLMQKYESRYKETLF